MKIQDHQNPSSLKVQNKGRGSSLGDDMVKPNYLSTFDYIVQEKKQKQSELN